MNKLVKHVVLVGTLLVGATCGGGGGGKGPTTVGGTGDTGGTGGTTSGGTTGGTGATNGGAQKAVYAPPLLAAPLPNDPAKVTIHRLSNGMTVYISPDSQEPTITAHIAVRAGGGQDPKISTGLAHYLEHMLFKGTSQLGTLDYAKEKVHLDKIAQLYADLRKPNANRAAILAEIDKQTQESAAYAVPNELDQMYSRMGISGLNAYTNNDATVYVTEIPKNRIAQWARVEVARYSDPVFRLFWPELEAVYEEKNRGLDNPGRQVHEAYMKAMFPQHGYGWSSVLGEIEHLKSPAYGDMMEFFHRYYTPGNMAILLSGDVDTSVLPLLEKEFGAFKRPAGDATSNGQVTKLNGRSVVEVKVPSTEGIMLGWPIVSATHKDRLAFELMDLILYDGRSGILSRDLLLTQKVASAGSSPTFLRDAGYFQLRADALEGQTHADLETKLLALVDKLKKGDFTDADVASAILTFEIQTQQTIESNGGRMSVMENSFILGEKWDEIVTRIDRMKKITKADIQRVATEYLTKDVLLIKKVKGKPDGQKIEAPKITPVKLDPSRQSAWAKSIEAMEVSPIEPVAISEGKDYERGKLATGELLTVKNTKNGLFSITFSYDYGRAEDKLACLSLDTLKVSGAGKRNTEEVARHLHENGLSIDVGCSKDTSAITISGIDRNLEAAMTLLREWLKEPMVDDATVKARVATILTERANSINSPNAVSSALQQYARVGGDSQFLVQPTNKELEKVTPADVKKRLAKFLDMKHRTSYFGPRAHKDAAALIVLGKGSIATKQIKPLKYRQPGTVYALDQDTKQMQIMMTWPRTPANDIDRAQGTLLSHYAGMLLYQEVREARGLAYTVRGWFDIGSHKTDDSAVSAYVGTQADKSHAAIDAVLETLAKDIDDKRLDTAKQTIAQNHRVDRVAPRSIPFTVYAWQDQGVKGDPRDERVKRVTALDKTAFGKWLKAGLGRKVIVSVSGPKKSLDEAKLKKLGPITWVPKEKVFGYGIVEAKEAAKPAEKPATKPAEKPATKPAEKPATKP
jgi:predicted Zn-dependent peptidase